jgi:hypothetical protein
MKPVLDYCVVTRGGKTTKIFVQEALKNRREIMWCPECGERVKSHDAYTPRSPPPALRTSSANAR